MSKGRCSAIKQGGQPCKALPMNGSEWCFAHHPNSRQALRSAGRKGGKTAGRGRPTSYADQLKEMRCRLVRLADRVEAGQLQPATAHALNGLLNTCVRTIELSHKLEVSEVLEARLAALEAAVEAEGGHLA